MKTYAQRLDAIYRSRKHARIDWDTFNPVDIVDIVLDRKARPEELLDLSQRVYESKRGGKYVWVFESDELCYEIAKGAAKAENQTRKANK